jgi:hypothetical protein
MGPFLLIAAIVFFLYCAFGQHQTEIHKHNEEQYRKTERCPPHKWDYNGQGFLQCSICHRTTEQIIGQ